jgi:hypothetical protein
MVQSHPTDGLNFKGLTGIFSTSLRRGSPFSVEIMGTHGFINIKDPANCPYSSVVNVGPDAYSSSTSASGIITQFPVKEICQKVRRIVLFVSPLTPHLSQNNVGANVFFEPLPSRPAQFGVRNPPLLSLSLSLP